MLFQKAGARLFVHSLLLSCLLAGCAGLPFGASATRGQSPEGLVLKAEQKLLADPGEASHKVEWLRQRERAVLDLLAAADKAHDAGNWEEAVLLYQRVLGLDDKNQNARRKLAAIEAERRYARLVADAGEMFAQGNIEGARNKLHPVLLEAPAHAGALELQANIVAATTAQGSGAPALKSSPNRQITLEFREANLKMVFEGLSRTSGINFVLDKDIKPDSKATVFVKNVTLDAAIAAILNTNQLEKKVLDATTLLIYPNTAQKNNEYRELVIKSFYLTNADVKQTAALLKTVLKVKNLHLDERLNLLVLRDTPEVVRLAEKMVALQDVAEPEVMLDVEVLELKRSKFTDIGITYPTNLTAGVLSNGAFSALTLDALRRLNDKSITVSPNPAINFQKTDGTVNLLANPRIRVKSREKAKVQIGDRVPVVTANISTTAATVSDSVQYLDVGLKLEVEPVVSLDDHVSIKVALEVGTIGTQTTTKNGSVVYQIGTRNASTLLRLKDGETQVLAGLINDEDRHNASKVPGLGDIPLLGRLFSDHSDNRTKTEIVLAITPHVINNLQRPGAEIMELWSGTETSIGDATRSSGKGAVAAVAAPSRPAAPEGGGEPAPPPLPEAVPATQVEQAPPAATEPAPPATGGQ
ncbi:MAG: proteinral secretion pathway protein D [Gallionellaceae bacterium]|nr:MAG: proteinral secretion pathway protein D [Gallionellaceae bacterium]